MKLYDSTPIRRALNRPHVSLVSIAKAAKVSVESVIAVRDEKSVNVETLKRVCKAVGVEVKELF